MKVIYKYTLRLQEDNVLILPVGYEIVSVQNQDSTITLWVMIDMGIKATLGVRFKIVGTGIPFDFLYHKHLSTVQVGDFIWHVFINTIRTEINENNS